MVPWPERAPSDGDSSNRFRVGSRRPNERAEQRASRPFRADGGSGERRAFDADRRCGCLRRKVFEESRSVANRGPIVCRCPESNVLYSLRRRVSGSRELMERTDADEAPPGRCALRAGSRRSGVGCIPRGNAPESASLRSGRRVRPQRRRPGGDRRGVVSGRGRGHERGALGRPLPASSSEGLIIPRSTAPTERCRFSSNRTGV